MLATLALEPWHTTKGLYTVCVSFSLYTSIWMCDMIEMVFHASFRYVMCRYKEVLCVCVVLCYRSCICTLCWWFLFSENEVCGLNLCRRCCRKERHFPERSEKIITSISTQMKQQNSCGIFFQLTFPSWCLHKAVCLRCHWVTADPSVRRYRAEARRSLRITEKK